MNFVTRFFTTGVLTTTAFWLVVISQVVVFYTIEPAPADYLMALAIFLVGLILILGRKLNRFGRLDVALALYLLLVVTQMLIYRVELDLRFALITVYLVLSYFAIKYLLAERVPQFIDWVWRAYVFGALITALVMISQMVWVYSFDGSWGSLYWGRPDGWFKDANVAGPALLPAILYSYYKIIVDRRWLYGGLLLVLSAGLYLSFSRGAYLAFICGLLFLTALCLWMVWKLNRGRTMAVVQTIIVAYLGLGCLWLGMLTYPPFADLTVERFSTLIKTYDTQGRAVSWETSLKESNNSPFGSGSGSYEKRSREFQESLGVETASPSAVATGSATQQEPESGTIIHTSTGEDIILTPSAHNSYLRVWLENGVVGLVLLVIFWLGLAGVAARSIWKIDAMPEWSRMYLLVTFVSFVAFLPMGTFIDTLHWRFLWVMAGVLGGLLVAVGRPTKQHDT